jgi:hypothetical protein
MIDPKSRMYKFNIKYVKVVHLHVVLTDRLLLLFFFVLYSRDTWCEYQSISAIVFVVFLYFAPVIYW